MMRVSLLSLLSLLALPATVLAHAGHGVGEGHEPGHYLLSPEHAVPVIIGVALLVAVYLFLREGKEIGSRKSEVGNRK